jgi:SSS family solute:Na+ symporter
VGRIATVVAIAISMLTSYINFLFSDLMEHVQLIFSVFGAPFFAIFLLGMTTRRVNQRGAIAGFLCGTIAAMLHLAAVSLGWLHYGSIMSADFYVAIYAFCTSVVIALVASSFGPGSSKDQSSTALQMNFTTRSGPLLWILSALLLAACISLNIFWR